MFAKLVIIVYVVGYIVVFFCKKSKKIIYVKQPYGSQIYLLQKHIFLT